MGVKERIEEFCKTQRISKAEFERSCGLSNGYINSVKNSIGEVKLAQILEKYPNLNKAWLILGEGEMTKGEKHSDALSQDVSCPDSVKFVPLVPTYAQAGCLNDYMPDGVTYNNCERIISPRLDVDMAITVMGDSMTPNYPNGCQLFIKRIDERAFIEWGKTYVLDTCNGTVVKRLMPTDNDNEVRCVSVNPEYPPFNVSLSDVRGVFRVVFSMKAE